MAKPSDDLPPWAQGPDGPGAFNLGPALEPRDLPQLRPGPAAGPNETQREILAALRQLSQAQAAEAALNARRQSEQQQFNRRLTWAALILAVFVIVVPFVLALVEAALELVAG